MTQWHDDYLNFFCTCDEKSNCDFCTQMYKIMKEHAKKITGISSKFFFKKLAFHTNKLKECRRLLDTQENII